MAPRNHVDQYKVKLSNLEEKHQYCQQTVVTAAPAVGGGGDEEGKEADDEVRSFSADLVQDVFGKTANIGRGDSQPKVEKQETETGGWSRKRRDGLKVPLSPRSMNRGHSLETVRVWAQAVEAVEAVDVVESTGVHPGRLAVFCKAGVCLEVGWQEEGCGRCAVPNRGQGMRMTEQLMSLSTQTALAGGGDDRWIVRDGGRERIKVR